MVRHRLVVLVCAIAASCSANTGKEAVTPATGSAAQSLNDAAANSCPWPANVAQFAQTTLIARHAGAPSPHLEVLKDVKAGCAVLTFSTDMAGVVSGSNVVAESPAGFGRIAAQILRWNDYATGTSDDTVFMVRLSAVLLQDGGVLLSLAFKDNTIDVVVPKSAGA